MLRIFIGLIFSLSMAISSTWIIKEDANLREKPSLDGRIIKVYLKNTKVKVLDIVHTPKSGRWYKLDKGYISTELIRPFSIDKKDRYSVDKYENAYVVIDDEVIIYKEADKNSTLVDKVSSGKIKVLCELDKKDIYPWYKVKSGYVNSSYILSAKDIKKCNENTVVTPIVKVVSNKRLKPIVKDKNIIKPRISKKVKLNGALIKKEKIVKDSKKVEDKKDFFLGVIVGVNSLTINTENKSGTVSLNTPLDESGYSYNLHIGANFDKNYRIVLNYDYIPVDDVTLENYYLSLNYQINRYLNPYIGLSTGISLLEWKIDPLTNSTTKKTDSEASGFIGIQAGLEHKYNKNYSVLTQLLYQELFHNTKVTNGTNEVHIKHDRLFQIGIGLRYFF